MVPSNISYASRLRDRNSKFRLLLITYSIEKPQLIDQRYYSVKIINKQNIFWILVDVTIKNIIGSWFKNIQNTNGCMCHNYHDMFHFPHSWLITRFVTNVTRGVLLVLTLPEHMCSPPIVCAIRVAWSFIFCVVYLCVLSLLTIVLSVLFKLRIVITPLISSNPS